MADSKIKDGTGEGNYARVDATQKLSVRAISETFQNEAGLEGNAFLLSTGFVNLTSANPSAVLYFKNNDIVDLLITRFLVSARNSTGGSENHCTVILYKNPIGIGSGSGIDMNVNNINFGSFNSLTNESEIGQEAATMTNGSSFGGFVIPLEQLTSEESSIVLKKGNSIGAVVIPPSGNTSFTIGIGINSQKIVNF